MADNAIVATIGANVEGLRRGATEAKGHVDSLIGKLKDFKAEQVSQSRTARFFATELADIAPGADSAKKAIQGLLNVVQGGTLMGMAFEAAIFAARTLKDSFEENKKAAAELKKIGVETGEQIAEAMKKVRDSFGPPKTDTEKAWEAALAPAHKELKKLQDEIDEIMKGKGGLRDFLAGAMGSARHMLAFQSTEEQTEGLAAKKGAILGAVEGARPEKAAAAAAEAKARREEEALDIAKWQADQVQEWGRHYNQVTEELARSLTEQDKLEQAHREHLIKAEYDAAEALKKFFRDQEDARLREYERVQKEIEKRVHEQIAVAKQMGDAFGTALAGIITGTESVGKAFADMAKAAIRAILDSVVKAIEAYALQAAAAAAAANAGIPGIGWVLMAAAAAAAEALIMGLLDSIPSAAVGMPRVAQDGPVYVHRNEAILTTQQAEAWRGEGGGSGEVHFHLHGFHDGGSIRSAINSAAFKREFRDLMRRGAI